MKKYLVTLLTLILLCGCTMTGTPTLKVSEYLGKFNSLDEAVIQDMESAIIEENLSADNTTIYRDVLKRQYKDMKYDIVDEQINGDTAVVTAKITVYDYYDSKVKSETYMNEHQDEFLDQDSVFNEESYMKYRLDQMMNMNDTITHEVSFNLTKQDDEWVIADIDRVTLEKIHGLYNYDLD